MSMHILSWDLISLTLSNGSSLTLFLTDVQQMVVLATVWSGEISCSSLLSYFFIHVVIHAVTSNSVYIGLYLKVLF